MRKIELALTGLYLAIPFSAFADTTKDNLCQGAGGSITNKAGKCNESADLGGIDRFLSTGVGRITNALIFIVGAISVIVIIIGAVRYVTSQGNNDQVKQAKDTILYAVIGLIVAILAYAIVTFVAGRIG